MEVIMALAIGILAGSGTWLVLRPRTFQVIIGLSLLSYAVNLFIFATGSLSIAREPVVLPWLAPTLENYSDPLPQALVLTAIVIGFATTALYLVLMMAARGLADTDHVDGTRYANDSAPPPGGPATCWSRPSCCRCSRRRCCCWWATSAAPRNRSSTSCPACARWRWPSCWSSGPTAPTASAPSACTCPATGKSPSASCSPSIGCRA